MKTTVYSCSGCSNLAQLCNSIAIQLHREKIARMSCIAGVGAEVASLVKFAKRSERVIVLDGCELMCSKKCLEKINVSITEHIVFTRLGLKKIEFETCDSDTQRFYFQMIKQTIKEYEMNKDERHEDRS